MCSINVTCDSDRALEFLLPDLASEKTSSFQPLLPPPLTSHTYEKSRARHRCTVEVITLRSMEIGRRGF